MQADTYGSSGAELQLYGSIGFRQSALVSDSSVEDAGALSFLPLEVIA